MNALGLFVTAYAVAVMGVYAYAVIVTLRDKRNR